ncbi:hypothetical protein MCUN1_000093 [Malassezia cuniculi]|uniref:Uncharacterized protein n=1 Tax=Malassezia cuniculi TaxID=948313 RepID=A0AAF0ENC6_9BASI|nr:hypothetical protein MCUN1_000093 [Malassezia cuniculi]
MMNRVISQFSQSGVEDHRCIGRVQCICMNGSVRQQKTKEGGDGLLRAAYALYFGPDHPQNFAAALSTPEYAPGFLQRKRPPSAVALLRRAELWSIVAILRYAITVLPPLSCAHVCIDSTYIAKAWSVWIPHWEKNGWPSENDSFSRLGNNRNRRMVDSDATSVLSAFDDTMSLASTTTRRSRRLINEDLLRELARLHNRCAELELRGDICVHLYLIDRANNPAEQMARAHAEKQLPQPQYSTEVPVRRPPSRAIPRPSELDKAEVSFESDMYEASDTSRQLRSHASEPSLRRARVAAASPLGMPENSQLYPQSSPAPKLPVATPTKSPAASTGLNTVNSSPMTQNATPKAQEYDPRDRRAASRASHRSENSIAFMDRIIPRFLRRKKKGDDVFSPSGSPEQNPPPLPTLAGVAGNGSPQVGSLSFSSPEIGSVSFGSPKLAPPNAFDSPRMGGGNSSQIGTAVVGSPCDASPSMRNVEAGLFSPGMSSPMPVAAPALPAELYNNGKLMLGEQAPQWDRSMNSNDNSDVASGLGIIVDPPEEKRKPASVHRVPGRSSQLQVNDPETRSTSRRSVRMSTSQPSLRSRRQVPKQRAPSRIEVEDDMSFMSSRLRATAKAVARAEQDSDGTKRQQRPKRNAYMDMVEDVPSSARTYASHPRPSGRRSYKMSTMVGDESSDEEHREAPPPRSAPRTPMRHQNVHESGAMQVSPGTASDSDDAAYSHRYR